MGDSKSAGGGGGLTLNKDTNSTDLANDLLKRLPAGLTLESGQNNKLLNIKGWKTGSGQEVPVQIGIGKDSLMLHVSAKVPGGYNPGPAFSRPITNTTKIRGELGRIKKKFGKSKVSVTGLTRTTPYGKASKVFGVTK